MKTRITLFLLLWVISNSANATRWFVNAGTGNDKFDGLSDTVGVGIIGPKKTIGAAIIDAASADTIIVAEGVYEEILQITKPLVIWGNNFGVDPLSQTRRPESMIMSPFVALGSGVSGNSIVELLSCCIEFDGFALTGDNPNISVSPTKYNKEYEISYGIACRGNYGNTILANLIITNFAISGIQLSSGNSAVKNNLITKCHLRMGEENSKAIELKRNFYVELNKLSVDSVGIGVSLDSFSSRSNQMNVLQFMDIRSEIYGINLQNFTGNTDVINSVFNNIRSLDTSLSFAGIYFNNLKSNGTCGLNSNVITGARNGIHLKNWGNLLTLNISDQTIADGRNGFNIEQPLGSPNFALNLSRCKISNLSGTSILTLSDGGLLTVNMNNMVLNKSANGIKLIGNGFLVPGNTDFSFINKYYIFLDSSASGKKPTTKIDATQCNFDGVLGYNLNNRQPFAVEDKIRHYLDRNYLGWVLFKYNSLYVTANDGNTLLTPAIKVASANWNIYLDSSITKESVAIDKTLHLYTHKNSSIGRFVMTNTAATLFLHGKIVLNTGLELKGGYIEVTDNDTLVVQRSAANTVLNPGTNTSYVKGTLYLLYKDMTLNYNIKDTFPIGKGSEFRPFYLNATWPAGITSHDIAVKMMTGKAPVKSNPSGITHISDIRHWQLINPFNQKGFAIKNIGLAYASTPSHDLVNDPLNLRVIFDDKAATFNLGGNGTTPNTGNITSSSGAPGYGFYTFGNSLGGNNMLSTTQIVALISAKGKCVNDTVEITSANTRSFSAITKYEWKITGPTSIISNENSAKIRKLLPVPGKYTITLIATNAAGSKDTVSTNLDIFEIPNVQYSKQLPCFPLPVNLTNQTILPAGTTIGQTEWKINANYFTSKDLSFTPIAPGTYNGHLKVTLNTGCYDSTSVTFNSPVAPSIKFTPNNQVSICSGDSVFVKIIKSSGLVVWNDGNTYDSLNIKTNTFYLATIYSTAECFRSDSIRTKILSLPTVNAGKDATVLPGQPIELKGTSNAMVEWSPALWLNDPLIQRPISRPLNTISYVLRAYNVEGCELTDTVTINVKTDDHVNVPNLLTPNGDGHNDKWVLSNIADPENCSVDIFTREGLNVYSTLSYENDFDGSRNGTTLEDGYYVYVIEHKPSGKIYKGLLTILK